MFRNNPAGRVLRFLDAQASPLEDVALIATLPPRLFLQALFQRAVARMLPGHNTWDERARLPAQIGALGRGAAGTDERSPNQPAHF